MIRLAANLRATKEWRSRRKEAHATPAMECRLSVVLETLVRRHLLPAILAVRSADQPTLTPVPDGSLQEQERIACHTLDMLLSIGFVEEECAKCLRRLIRVIDGHGCAEAVTARDDRRHEVPPPTPGPPKDLPSPNNLFRGELHNDTELATSCRDSKGQAGVIEEMQELELMVEPMGGMTSTDFNQQLSTTSGKAMRPRKARIDRDAGTRVDTPVCTSARDDGKHESSIDMYNNDVGKRFMK
jgi:hypothetical protein